MSSGGVEVDVCWDEEDLFRPRRISRVSILINACTLLERQVAQLDALLKMVVSRPFESSPCWLWDDVAELVGEKLPVVSLSVQRVHRDDVS
jgi:hypothetical protein